MKLVRYGTRGAEKPGLIDAEGRLRDLSAHVADIAGPVLAELDALKSIDPASLPLVDGDPRYGACVGGIGKFICIGLNYSDHAAANSSQCGLFSFANSARTKLISASYSVRDNSPRIKRKRR